jgi:hypothetical protein
LTPAEAWIDHYTGTVEVGAKAGQGKADPGVARQDLSGFSILCFRPARFSSPGPIIYLTAAVRRV